MELFYNIVHYPIIEKSQGSYLNTVVINYSCKFALKVEPHQSYTQEGSGQDHKYET